MLKVSSHFDQLEVQLKKIRQGTYEVPNSFKKREDLDNFVTVLEDEGQIQHLPPKILKS